jgi:putative ABC transport system ATP-binding protein
MTLFPRPTRPGRPPGTDPVSAAGQHAVIELRGVSKHYGTGSGQPVAAADDVSFAIEHGGLIALAGASGSGKSTLLHLIGAIERPDSGTIVNDGTEVTALRGAALAAYRRSVGFVFQRYNLLPALTALDNVIAPVLPYRTGWDKAARGRQLLEAVGLGGRERSLPSRMSGGEQQRVAIARALINSPHLLLADEPTGNLDSRSATGVLDLLARVREENQMTVIIATHDPQIAARCDRLIRLRDGAVTDDIEIADGYPVEETIRRAGQLGLTALACRGSALFSGMSVAGDEMAAWRPSRFREGCSRWRPAFVSSRASRPRRTPRRGMPSWSWRSRWRAAGRRSVFVCARTART